ncbi:MAG: sugar phosphate isomerase/epimerase family protein [Devosia sp.]
MSRPIMSHPLSLAFLTTFDVGPLEAVRIAAETGYSMVGLRFLPSGGEAAYPIMTDTSLQRDVAAALTDTGIQLADIEIARLGPDVDIDAFRPFCELGQKLGARHVLVAGDDPDQQRLIRSFAKFCALAADYGLTADLEFMPWTAVKNLRSAQAIVEGAGQANGGVLIDALHFDRSDSSLEDIRALPSSRINYAQICDGPVPFVTSDAALIHTARAERLLPGDGGIDLVGMLNALPKDLPISIEIPQHGRSKTISAKQRASEALKRTMKLLGLMN